MEGEGGEKHTPAVQTPCRTSSPRRHMAQPAKNRKSAYLPFFFSRPPSLLSREAGHRCASETVLRGWMDSTIACGQILALGTFGGEGEREGSSRWVGAEQVVSSPCLRAARIPRSTVEVEGRVRRSLALPPLCLHLSCSSPRLFHFNLLHSQSFRETPRLRRGIDHPRAPLVGCFSPRNRATIARLADTRPSILLFCTLSTQPTSRLECRRMARA